MQEHLPSRDGAFLSELSLFDMLLLHILYSLYSLCYISTSLTQRITVQKNNPKPQGLLVDSRCCATRDITGRAASKADPSETSDSCYVHVTRRARYLRVPLQIPCKRTGDVNPLKVRPRHCESKVEVLLFTTPCETNYLLFAPSSGLA